MIGTPTADVSQAAAAAEPLVFGDDAVAIADRRLAMLTWASEGWRVARPDLPPGTTLAGLCAALPELSPVLAVCALREGRESLKDLDAPGARAHRSRTVDEPAPASASAGRWAVETRALEAGRIAVRLTDRHAQSLAMQRQLDDRERLLFTSRVLSVGEMATTLAHELNQPIATTAGLLRGLRSRVAQRMDCLQAEEVAALERAIGQVMFASKVIARIREFTHSHRPRFERVDLAALLRTSIDLLDWDLQRAGVTAALDCGDAGLRVEADPVMLQQVIVNLVRNAIDALRHDPPATPRVAIRLLTADARAEIQVSDNGCGMDDEAAHRLFVPFASTKPSGMGLGLSICRSFVEHHQGRLWFSRNADRGATFHVGLPIAGGAPGDGDAR